MEYMRESPRKTLTRPVKTWIMVKIQFENQKKVLKEMLKSDQKMRKSVRKVSMLAIKFLKKWP